MGQNKSSMTKPQYELLASLRYSLRQFQRFSERAATRAGVTPQQHMALLAIKGFPGRDWLTIGELAERLQIVHNAAVGLADRLVRRKYVERKRGGGDRRLVFLKLTRQGQTLLETLSAAHHEQLRQLGPRINALLTRLDDSSTKPACQRMFRSARLGAHRERG
ncbi:MAG TPA: MarR family transcriptional regulator [Verrucomicrobiae bacterium]|nr:MarR family transcriptional regulator [Verrucomicrobiae bacterium]